jgi:hypothetical protein
METEMLLLCSQQTTTGHHPELDESNLHHPTRFL